MEVYADVEIIPNRIIIINLSYDGLQFCFAKSAVNCSANDFYDI